MKGLFGRPHPVAAARADEAALDRSLRQLRGIREARPAEDLAERLQVTALLPEAELAAATKLLNAFLDGVRIRGGRTALAPSDVASLGVVMGEFLNLFAQPGQAPVGASCGSAAMRDAAHIAAVERELGYPRPAMTLPPDGDLIAAVKRGLAAAEAADPASGFAVAE